MFQKNHIISTTDSDQDRNVYRSLYLPNLIKPILRIELIQLARFDSERKSHKLNEGP